MPQISKRILKPEVKKDLLDSLSYTIKELKTKKDVDSFLSSALTDTERIMVAKRVLTAFLLRNNVEEKKIGDTLKLTPSTITRLKMWIDLRREGFDLVFNKLEKRSRENIAKQIFYKVLNYSIKAAFGRIPKPF
ncbi:MAG: TrpR like protein, YerC/YecD [Candidatus Woesebacteria bacterium GW2011_GWA2_40_7b]|uniref:TrpR like protein, YerC/YecD n=1 Tax=Candidatus Woesebacteria bacterium GW2011_GWA2_40_7b TaxID=1618563 RepID=A0A0G0W5K4_9BACT|nr:MAG: TrpR like protein, YerC/YecD [Candidatus Woesebacteria bacterium GW2011_GWA2_40_7b]